MKKVKLLILALIVLSFNSCNKDERKNKIELTSNVEVKSELISIKDSIPDLLKFKKYDLSDSSRINIIIVEWDFARPAFHCQRGFGFCNVVWFRTIKEFINWVSDLFKNTTYSINYAPLLYDELNDNYYIDILLSEPAPDRLHIEHIPLTVEEDIFVYLENENINKKLFLKAGNYFFDKKLDEFGGFRVNLFFK